MAGKERTVDLVVRAKDQFSGILANLQKQQTQLAEAGRKAQLQFSTATRRELTATQAEIKKLSGEFRTLASTQGASRAELAQLMIAKAKLQARAGELKGALDGVQQATHRLKVGQAGSFRDFVRNTGALQSQSSAATANAASLRKVETAANGASRAQQRMATSTQAAGDALEIPMNRGGSRDGLRGENQDVEIYGLRPYQMVNLGYQVNDVVSGLAMGQPPLQIFAQQIGQVIQIWPQMMVGIVRAIPILGSLAAIFTPIITAMVRVRNEAGNLRYFNSQLSLMADGGLYSAQGLAATTREIQNMGVALNDARKIALDFAKAGVAQGDMLPLVRMARDISRLTGAEVGETAQKLSKAFRGTVDDVRKLDEELQFLTAAQLEQIRAMDRQGDRAGALRLAQESLRTSLESTRTEQSEWGKAVDELSDAWNNLIDAIERSGVIEIAAKGLDLLAKSARGYTMTLDRIAESLNPSDMTQYLNLLAKIEQAQQSLQDEQARNQRVTDMFGGLVPVNRDGEELLASELANLQDEMSALLATMNQIEPAAEAAVGPTEEQKKLQLDIDDILRDQLQTMQDEVDTAAMTNRERHIEAALLDARNKALERANELGEQFNGLTEEQTRLLRDQAGMAFDRQAANNLISGTGGMGSLVDRIVGVESGGNPTAKNPNSTATGLGQFIESTWLSMFRKYFPAEAANMGREAILELRKDAAISRQMIELYARENAKVLQGAGVAVNDAALYLAHFLGPRGAAGVLAARPGTPVSDILGQDQINANRSILEGKNASEVVAWAQRKMGISQTELEITTALGEQESRRLETAREYNEAYLQRIASQEFEISQASVMARQAAINKAIREEELAAQKAGLELTAEQRAEIERTTGALFDRQNVELEVNRLMEQRQLLVESLNLAQSEGDAGRVAEIITEIQQTEADLQDAITAAIQFWQAIGGPGADAAILKLQNLRGGIGNVVEDLQTQFLPTAEEINNRLSEVGSNAFSKMAEAIANGTNVAEAFFQTLIQGIGQFLVEIGKAIVQQALFNAISGGTRGGGAGGGIAGFITGLFMHSGGIVGRGAGSGSRMVNPGIFANAQRFHSGGVLGLGPNEVPIVGLKDEEMLTRDDPRHILNGGGSSNVNVKNVNVFDPSEVLEAALATEAGERIILNFMSRRARTINGALAT